jgi:hypothetical protein
VSIPFRIIFPAKIRKNVAGGGEGLTFTALQLLKAGRAGTNSLFIPIFVAANIY